MRVLMLVVLMLVAVTGCSTTGSAKKKTFVNDEEKIAYVNSVARNRGTQVIWVHLPEKRVDAAKAGSQKATP